MKIDGKDVNLLEQKEYVLPRNSGDIPLLLSALPLGFQEKIERFFPTPTPPKAPVKGANGKLQRENGIVVVTRNVDDPHYKEQVKKMDLLQAIYVVHCALRNDKSINFETDIGQLETNPQEFYEGIYEELDAAGFTVGDILDITKGTMELSNMSSEKFKDLSENFTS